MQKKISFAVSNPLKCIANLRTQPMHFKMNLEIYQTSFVMKEVVWFPVSKNIIEYNSNDLQKNNLEEKEPI